MKEFLISNYNCTKMILMQSVDTLLTVILRIELYGIRKLKYVLFCSSRGPRTDSYFNKIILLHYVYALRTDKSGRQNTKHLPDSLFYKPPLKRAATCTVNSY